MSKPFKNNLFVNVAFILIVTMLQGCGSDNSAPNSPNNTGDVEFTNVRADNITSHSAIARFTTNLPTTCDVEYGLNGENLDLVATDPSMTDSLAVDHTVPLEDLKPETQYYYRARATDSDSTTFRSDIERFTTLPDTATVELINVALLLNGTTVTEVSSNYGNGNNDSSWGVHKALDDMMSTEWSSHGDGDKAYVVLDFGRIQNIKRFGFRSRKMYDGSSIITSVKLIFDGNTIYGPFDTSDPDIIYAYDIVPSVDAQTVKIETVTSTGGNTGAKEIQFFSPEN